MHVGYEWWGRNTSSWNLSPAVELEGYYYAQTKKVTLINPTDQLDFHEFIDTFPMRVGIILANFSLALNNKYLTPYIGLGLGAGIVSIHNAKAIQLSPPETVNHFNTNPNCFSWTFAAQGKAGLRYSLFKNMRIFAEYRFLFLAANDYSFGHTVAPGHVATADWNIRFGGIWNNMFALGIDFPLY